MRLCTPGWRNTIFKFLVNLISAFGLLWLLVEISDFFGNKDFSDGIKNYWWLFGLLGLGYAILKLFPKSSYEFKVPNRDANIFIKKKFQG